MAHPETGAWVPCERDAVTGKLVPVTDISTPNPASTPKSQSSLSRIKALRTYRIDREKTQI